jgi:NADPH:quinone reductase-like Zn-dependent oxidoreductase
MRAFILDSFGAQPVVRDDLPEPHVDDDELLVRVHASSVNPVDVFIAAGALKDMAEPSSPSLSAATSRASSSRSAPA